MKSQIEVIKKTVVDAKTQFSSYGEQLFDLAVDNEAWENIPLVDQATKILNIRDVYRKNRIKRNYAAFIDSVKDIDKSGEQHFLDLMSTDVQETEDIAETIFEIITESEKPIKSRLLGNLLKALAMNKINLSDFDTLTLLIQSSSIPALRAVTKFTETHNSIVRIYRKEHSLISLLGSIGLLIRDANANGFRLTQLGLMTLIYAYELDLKKPDGTPYEFERTNEII